MLCRRPVSARDATLPGQPLPLPNPWAVLVGNTGSLVERNGRLVLDLPGLHPVVDGALDLATRGRNLANRRARTRA